MSEKKPDLGAYLTSINSSKENLMRSSEDPRATSAFEGMAFPVRRLLSYHKDAIFYANEINCIPGIDGQMQYEFFLHALPRKKRFGGMTKPEPNSDDLALIMTFYNYSEEKAEAILPLHSPEQLETMRQRLSEGGIIK